MPTFWILLLLVISFIGLLLFRKHRRDKHYFESQGVKYSGNTLYQLILLSIKGISVVENIKTSCQKMRSENIKIAGASQFGKMAIFINDVDLLKQVLVKDFDHFVNRQEFGRDKLFSKMLISRQGDDWKVLRSKMSPTFTTGKIRRMFKIMDASAAKLVKFVEEEMLKSISGEIDLSTGYSKFTMDVIASTACGIDSKAFEQSEPSVFEQMGTKMQFNFGGLQLLKMILIVTLPNLADKMGLSIFSGEAGMFFSRAIKGSIKHREELGEKRDDFIQLLLEARKGLLKIDESELERFEKDAIIKTSDNEESNSKVSAELLDDDGIVANCVLFIFAGFDVTQSLLLYAAYALALYPDLQERLRTEILEELEQTDGKFTYDGVIKMQYLDMFLNETLRFYPPSGLTDRSCIKDYKVPGTDFVVKKGDTINVPICGIHFDDRYYPEPEKFDPERFSPENRGNLNPYAFLPFGHGPRNCIGMRFALMEVKLAMGHLVKNFYIQPSQKTLIPMKYQNVSSLKPVGGMWLALNKINH